MANGSITSNEFNNGCKFEVRWTQIEYPESLYSVLKFDLYFYTPRAGVTIYNPSGYLDLIDSRQTSIVSTSYTNLAVHFDTVAADEDTPITFNSVGYHKIEGYTTYATKRDWRSMYHVAESSAFKIQHYSSGSPKSFYKLEPAYPYSQFLVNLGHNGSYPTDQATVTFGTNSIVLDAFEDSDDSGSTTASKPSTIICSDAYIGDNAKITITANENFVKHTVTYAFGNLQGTIVTQSSQLALSWEIPYEFINEIPTGASHGTCYLTCVTYDSLGQLIGTTTTTFIARMDVNAEAPTFNPIIVDSNHQTVALTGDENIFIRYYSDASITIGAVGKAGATIASQSANCAGKTINTASGVISKVESATFDLTATDNRGATSKTTINKILIPYTRISCNVFELNMATDGTLTFVVQGNYYNDSFGATSNKLTVEYKINDGEYITVDSSNIEITGHNYEARVTVTGLNYRESYSVEAIATDKLSSAGYDNIYTITGQSIFDWGKEDFNFNVPVSMQGSLEMAVDQGIYGNGGEPYEALMPRDSSGNTTLGRGGYQQETGRTIIYGNAVDIIAHEGVTVNGKTIAGHVDKILWSGVNQMGSGTSINLSDAISAQASGIVLVFSLYRNNAAEDVSINSFFVSKKEIELLSGAPHTFLMAINAGFSNIGAKYLYIYDNSIEGHEGNTISGTNSGITFNNSSYVLRYVIGV